MNVDLREVWPLPETRQELLLKNAHRLLRKQYKNAPLWALVSDLTGHGSQVSSAICNKIGWNPSQSCELELGSTSAEMARMKKE